MIPIQVLKDYAALAGYPVESLRYKEIDLMEIDDLPLVLVGYASIDSEFPNAPIAVDLYNNYGEDLVQSFDIQIVCLEADLPTIWKRLYSNIIGKTPTTTLTGLSAASGFTYAQGGPIGISNGKLWWLDRWRISFPTTNVNSENW
jgi:hypothetical protein